MGLWRFFVDGAKLILFYFELLVCVAANLAVRTSFVGATMPAM